MGAHPGGEPVDHEAPMPSSPSKQPPAPPPLPEDGKTKPASGTYVIQLPKDQIYRVPTAETAQRYEEYTRRSRRRSCCCRLLLWIVAVILALVVALGITAGVLYLVFRPKFPRYGLEGVSIKSFDLTSRRQTLPSLELDLTVSAENPNAKIGIHYRSGGSVIVSHSGVDLCSGAWPAFYQGPKNSTVFREAMSGSGVRFAAAARGTLVAEQWRGAVPLDVGMRVPVRVKFGAVTIWTVTVVASCEVTLNGLTANAKLVSTSCHVKKVKIF